MKTTSINSYPWLFMLIYIYYTYICRTANCAYKAIGRPYIFEFNVSD